MAGNYFTSAASALLYLGPGQGVFFFTHGADEGFKVLEQGLILDRQQKGTYRPIPDQCHYD